MKYEILCRLCRNPIGVVDLIDNCSRCFSVSYICTDCDRLVNHRLEMGGITIGV